MGTQYQKSAYNKYENLFRWAAHKLKLQEKFERKKHGMTDFQEEVFMLVILEKILGMKRVN